MKSPASSSSVLSFTPVFVLSNRWWRLRRGYFVGGYWQVVIADEEQVLGKVRFDPVGSQELTRRVLQLHRIITARFKLVEVNWSVSQQGQFTRAAGNAHTAAFQKAFTTFVSDAK